MILTPSQQAVLDELVDHYERNGQWPVRVRDLMARSSPSTIHVHLMALEKLGFIEKGPGKTGWRPK